MRHKEEKLDRSLFLVFSNSSITLLQFCFFLSKSTAPFCETLNHNIFRMFDTQLQFHMKDSVRLMDGFQLYILRLNFVVCLPCNVTLEL